MPIRTHPCIKRPLVAVALCALVTAAGCGGKREVIRKDDILANLANTFYAKERYFTATDNYRKLIDEHPDSAFRKQAVIGIADSLYKDKKFFEAVLYYERFTELYPLDPLTPRALFYLSMSYYHDTTTRDRDQSSTQKAIDTFNLFLATYPDHRLAAQARKRRADMTALLAGSKLAIARFYHRINRNQSAITRLKEFIAVYPDSHDLPEALYLLADCYMIEQSYRKAAETFTILIKTYPDSGYAKTAAAQAKRLDIIKKE